MRNRARILGLLLAAAALAWALSPDDRPARREAVVAVPAEPPAPPEASAEAVTDDGRGKDEPAAAVPPEAGPPLPPLPEREVAAHEVHVPPPEPDQGGAGARPLGPPSAERTIGRSTEVALGAAAAPALPAAPRQFTGLARPSGAAALEVGSIPVRLFGIKPPGAGERCAAGRPDADCAAMAQASLAARLGGSAKVTCRVPNPHPGVVIAFAICLDEAGTDLGGYLVDQGLALADTGQSYDYVGAESIARNLKRGLWQFH